MQAVRVGEGFPYRDFGGALRVTDGRSGESRQRPPKAGPQARLWRTDRAQQPRPVRDRTPLLRIATRPAVGSDHGCAPTVRRPTSGERHNSETIRLRLRTTIVAESTIVV